MYYLTPSGAIGQAIGLVSQSYLWQEDSQPWGSVRALSRPCLGLFLFIPTLLSLILLTPILLLFLFLLFPLLLLFLCLLLPLPSPLLFPCVRYPVWDTHYVHGIPGPRSPYQMFPCISGALLWIHRAPETLILLFRRD